MSQRPLFATNKETIEYLVEKKTSTNEWWTANKYIARQNYYFSRKAIAEEKKRQLNSPYFVIHPFSLFRYYWEMWMVIIYLIAFLFIPFESCNIHYTIINKKNFVNYGVPLFSLHIIFILDMILTFFSGYVESNSKQIILNRKKIAWRYIKTYFFIDVLGTIPSLVNNFPLYILSGKVLHKKVIIINFIKLLRVITFTEYCDKYATVYNNIGVKYKIFQVLMSSVFLIHWLTCLIFVLQFTYYPMSSVWYNESHFDTRTYYEYIVSVSRALDLMLTCGSVKPISNELYVIFTILCAVTGIFYTIYLLVKMIDITRTIMEPETKYDDFMKHLEDYMIFNKIPKNTQQLMILYFQHRYQGIYYQKDSFVFSKNNIYEIKYFRANKLMQKVSLFKTMEPEVLEELLDKFAYKVYLPKDVIIKHGSICRFICFITYGTVAIYTSSGKEIIHLYDGNYFGISGLLLPNHKHPINVIAVSICELYLLDREYFLKAIKSNEETYNLVVEQAKKRMRIIKAAEALETSVFDNYGFVRNSNISLLS